MTGCFVFQQTNMIIGDLYANEDDVRHHPEPCFKRLPFFSPLTL
jgi:hypothetical protein